ncbi:hypothetical protein CGSMWGv55152_01014 [Gardnerella vaginalis 55152]|uniref:Gram-positive cocci surface proteins LPxTG domain-containing protein n=3 Tax=Gardnerella vaginalis TaxID=2702 RepID=I4LVL7_GARVA|nr:hypothetical protein CGSMWGv55152_01014 [Gardnerella vaginalis 55152]EPI48642.1 LPXTG-motif protein cell wall anchor domain protein [Gardnerella vaginalis JCP8108]
MKLDPNEGLTNTIKKTETRMHINAIDQLMRRGTKETNNNHSPNTPLVPEAHEPPTRPTKPLTSMSMKTPAFNSSSDYKLKPKESIQVLPKTGESSSLDAFLSALGLSLAGLGVLYKKKSMKDRE